MIEEQVQVVGIEGDQLILEAQVKTTCGSCEARQACGTAVLSKVVGRKFSHFKVKNTVDAQVGDTIVIGLPERVLLSGSLLIYFLPVFGMIILALLADFILLAGAPGRDLSIALSAFFGFGLCVLLARWILSSRYSRLRLTPVIIKKMDLDTCKANTLVNPFPVKTVKL